MRRVISVKFLYTTPYSFNFRNLYNLNIYIIAIFSLLILWEVMQLNPINLLVIIVQILLRMC